MRHQSKSKQYVQVFLAVELVLLLIAFLMPITPGKTGSKKNLAEWFFDNPTYLESVFFHWVFLNLIAVLLAILLLIWWRRAERNGDAQASKE